MRTCFRFGLVFLSLVLLPTGSAFAFECPALGFGNQKADAFLKREYFPAMPGKTIGIFTSGIAAAWKRDGRTGPAEMLGFSSDASSFRIGWTPGLRGINAKVLPVGQIPFGESGSESRFFSGLDFPVALTLARWNIRAKHSLVEVEVNHGSGAPKGSDAFVATKVTPLENTKDFNVDSSMLIEKLSGCFETEIAETQKSWKRAMESARYEVAFIAAPKTPITNQVVVLPTWMNQEKTFRVAFLRESVQTIPATEVKAAITYGSRMIAAYHYGADGKLKGAIATRPENFVVKPE